MIKMSHNMSFLPKPKYLFFLEISQKDALLDVVHGAVLPDRLHSLLNDLVGDAHHVLLEEADRWKATLSLASGRWIEAR